MAVQQRTRVRGAPKLKYVGARRTRIRRAPELKIASPKEKRVYRTPLGFTARTGPGNTPGSETKQQTLYQEKEDQEEQEGQEGPEGQERQEATEHVGKRGEMVPVMRKVSLAHLARPNVATSQRCV